MTARNHNDFLGIVATGLADNASGLITAKVLRDISTDMVDTIYATSAASGSLFNVSDSNGRVLPIELGS